VTAPKRTGLIDVLDALLASIRDTQRVLREVAPVYKKFRDQVEGGMTVGAALREARVAKHRESLINQLAEFEKLRHEARRMIVHQALAEGLSIAEIGRIYGFSRQLAARYAKEARSASA
jgi:hypothetical protein